MAPQKLLTLSKKFRKFQMVSDKDDAVENWPVQDTRSCECDNAEHGADQEQCEYDWKGRGN